MVARYLRILIIFPYVRPTMVQYHPILEAHSLVVVGMQRSTVVSGVLSNAARPSVHRSRTISFIRDVICQFCAINDFPSRVFGDSTLRWDECLHAAAAHRRTGQGR